LKPLLRLLLLERRRPTFVSRQPRQQRAKPHLTPGKPNSAFRGPNQVPTMVHRIRIWALGNPNG
jgi:hypothetical protein